MLLPASAFLGLLVIGGVIVGSSASPVETEVAGRVIAAPEETTTTAAPVDTTSTTAPSTTTTTAPPTNSESTYATVSDSELTRARQQLNAATVVTDFEGFTDYDRDTYDGGGWPDTDGNCISDRHEILIEESLTNPTLDPEGCRVESGLWLDPYDGTEYTNAELVSIDHMIPLAAAHRAGAWQWDEASRRAFAADISFPATHVVVGTEVNQEKADRGPEDWRPSTEASWCRYAVDWIAVKDRWSLAFSEAEVAALEIMLDTCDPVVGINPLSTAAAEVSPTITTTSTTSTTSTTTSTTTTSTTTTAAPATVAETQAPAPDCHPNYDPCLPNRTGDALNCGDISAKNIQVSGSDPYRLDRDNDGIGCES